MAYRIYKNKLYICCIPTGISGFAGSAACGMVTGAAVKRDLLTPWAGRLPGGNNLDTATFRLSDGRMPEFQERANFERARQFLAENPNAVAYIEEDHK